MIVRAADDFRADAVPEEMRAAGDREDRTTSSPFHHAPIWIGFGLVAVVCAIVSLIVGVMTARLESSAEWTEHTHLVIERLVALQNTINEASTAERNYVISGGDTSVDSAIDALERQSQTQLAELRHLTADNPEQQRNFDALAPLITKRMAFLRSSVVLRRKSNRGVAEAFLVAHFGNNFAIEIRTLINRMVSIEDVLLTRRGEVQRRAARLAFNTAWIGWLSATTFLVIAGLYMGGALRGLRAANALADRRRVQVEDARIALGDSTELLRSVVASMAEGMVVWMQGNAEPELNPAARLMLGITAEPGAFSDWLALVEIGADSLETVTADHNPFAQIAKGVVSDDVELAIRDPRQQSTRWIKGSLRPLRASHGGSRGGVMVFHETTETRRLDELRANLAAIVSATPDAIVSIDPAGKVYSWNHGAEIMYGYTAGEALNQQYENLVVPENLRHEFSEALLRITAGEPIVQIETRRVNKAGVEFDVSITDFPIAVQSRRVLVGSIARDITERKRVQRELVARSEELARSNSELEQFAYVSSHDLQEPLRMITSYLQLIVSRYQHKLDSDGEEFIRYAVDGATRMKQLIDDLLNFSRAGQARRHEPVDMNRILEQTLANLQLAIEETGARITSDHLPVVFGDPLRMRELLQNLIENAVKFRSKEVPAIHVGCQSRGDEWIFSVRDNGVGIAPEYHERIFVMFRRLHKRDVYRGNGIGLAICKRVVERQHGRIWVESALGAGATFFFSIPTGEGGGRDERPGELEGSGHTAG